MNSNAYRGYALSFFCKLTLAISPNSIRAFTDEYSTANSEGESNSFSNFEKSFVAPLLDRTRKKEHYLIEGYNGILDVKTIFLGKSVCYKFDADADLAVTFFYKCNNDVGFIFEMKR